MGSVAVRHTAPRVDYDAVAVRISFHLDASVEVEWDGGSPAAVVRWEGDETEHEVQMDAATLGDVVATHPDPKPTGARVAVLTRGPDRSPSRTVTVWLPTKGEFAPFDRYSPFLEASGVISGEGIQAMSLRAVWEL